MKKLSIFASVLLLACESPPPQKQILPPTPTPTPINGSRITKNTNVSFNTYSKEWPVEWEWKDPDRHPVTPHDTHRAVLHLVVPKGKDLSLERNNAPRYLKAVSGDLEMETKVTTHPVLNNQGAGMLVWLSETDYIRFERSTSDGVSGMEVLIRQGDEIEPLVTTRSVPTDAAEVWLKIRREGPTFVFLWRDSDKVPWSEIASYRTDYPLAICIGLVATNTADDFDVDFGYIRFGPLKK